MAIASKLELKGLGRQKMAALAARARTAGMTPERYLRQLVDEDLAIAHDARTKTFAQIMGPDAEIDDPELDQLIEKIRNKHYREITAKKRS